MQIILKISLQTDGDFSLRNYEKYHMNYDGVEGYYNKFIFNIDTPAYMFEDEHDIKMTTGWRASTLLEKMLCDLHIYYTHHYLIQDLFNMFDSAIENVGKYPSYYEASLGGNYDGTYIEIECNEEV